MSRFSDTAARATAEALANEACAVRDFIASNRSDTLLRLFDFLFQQSIEGRRPREAEIAEEIFQGDAGGPARQGSRTRVAIYRLRKKLDLYYADKSGARLVIPQGEYGLVIESRDHLEAGETLPDHDAVRDRRFGRGIWVAASALILANAALAWYQFGDAIGIGGNAARSALWRPFDDKASPTIVAIGDYFMFSETTADGGEEVMQDLSIDSPDALYEHLVTTAGVRDSIKNEDLYAVSSDILASLSRLWAYLADQTLRPIASSALDPAMMQSSDIVYVGALDALSPLLGNPLFEASQFRCGATCYELVDQPSGRRFLSDSPLLLGDHIIPRRDYGYIASYPGPSGNQILIISGTGDAGVTQMIGVATDPARIAQLHQHIGDKFQSFEALYQVRTMFNQSYGSSLLIVRPINSDRIWDKTKRSL